MGLTDNATDNAGACASTSFEGLTHSRTKAALNPSQLTSSSLSIQRTDMLKAGDPCIWSSIKVAISTRIIQITIAVLNCLLAAGIVFGYAALKSILIEEHIYRDYCSQEELDRNVHVCVQQEIRLNLMFTVAAVATNVSALPVGTLLDKYGPRTCGLISSVFLFIGALLFVLSRDIPFDVYLIGYVFLAIGGAFTFLPYLHLSNTFPRHSGLILSMITGSFDSSSALFLLYKSLYFQTGKKFGPTKFFLVYLMVPIFAFLAQLLYMPRVSYKSVREGNEAQCVEEIVKSSSDVDESTALLGAQCQEHDSYVTPHIAEYLSSEATLLQAKKEEEKNAIHGVWGVMHSKSVQEQIKSPWFILMTVFTILQMVRINYFIATVHPQYEYILGSFEDAVEVNAIFDTALPLGGLLAIPITGLILDNVSTLSVFSLMLTTATIIGSLGCLRYKWAAYSNVLLFVLFRPFFYTALSDYSAKVFGFKTFGTVYGLMMSISGVFNLVANVLDHLCLTVFHRNPVPINLVLMAAALVSGSSLCCYMKMKLK